VSAPASNVITSIGQFNHGLALSATAPLTILGKLEKQKISLGFVRGRQALKLGAFEVGMPRDFAARAEQPVAEGAFGHLHVLYIQGSDILLHQKPRAVGKRTVYFHGFGYFGLHHHSRPLLEYLCRQKIPAFIQRQGHTARIVGAVYLMPPLSQPRMNVSRHASLAKPV